MYDESTKHSVWVCVKDKRDLYQQEEVVQGCGVSPLLGTCEPTAGVVSSFGLLSRRQTLTHLSESSTGHCAAGQGLEQVVYKERLRPGLV